MTCAARALRSAVGDLELDRRDIRRQLRHLSWVDGREGGVGPSLRDEQARQNYDATVAWIENPLPPMPKLFPSPVSEESVRDVAAYVQSL